MTPHLSNDDDLKPTGRLASGLSEGRALAAEAIKRTRAGTTNGDEVLRAVLSALASDGRVIPPSPALRGACEMFQGCIARGDRADRAH